MSLSKNENHIQSDFGKNSEENIQLSSNRLIPKKKVSSMSISASLPPNFGQSSAPVQLRSSPQKETSPPTQNQWPSLSESNISQPKQAKTQTKKKRITPTLVVPQDQSQKPLQELPVTSILPTPPVPTLVHQMSTTMKSHFDHLGIVVEVHDSKKNLKDPNTSFENSVSQLLIHDQHSINDERPTIALARLARLYSALVKSKLIPIIPTVLFLSRLLSSRHTCVIVGKEITVSTGTSPKFPSYFLNDFSLSFFLAEASLNLSDIIQSLGDQFCASYAELVLDLSPIVSQSLLSRSRRSSSFTQEEYSELYPFMGQDQTASSVDREEYIRPFHEERDNRHEYRGKIEGIVYNEREKCFDEFSNLFRRYSDINRSDLDGSKTEEFWPILAQIGTKVLTLSDCNFIWFAQIFKDMLLFHGTNLPKDTSASSSTSSGAPSGPGRTSPHPTTTSQFRHLEERLGPGGGAQGSSSMNHHPNPNRQNQFQFNEKHRLSHLLSTLKDPSALFPGYQQFFFKFLLIMDSAKLNHYLSDIFLEEILSLTDVLSKGDYRDFVAVLRSGEWIPDSLPQESLRLRKDCQSLKATLLLPTNQQSRDRTEIPTPTRRHISFNIRIFHLRILGKFFGLLHSYPSWTLSLNGSGAGAGGANVSNSSGSSTSTNHPESPLIEMITRAASLRNNLNSTLPISRLLYLSWKDSTLTLAVSWIVSYLRMMAWDKTSILHISSLSCNDDPHLSALLTTVKSEHLSCIAVLTAILSSADYQLSSHSLSRNKLYVFLEIQSLFTEFPALLQLQPHLLSRIQPPQSLSSLSEKTRNHGAQSAKVGARAEAAASESTLITLDEGDAAFTEIFTKHVIPSLYEMYIFLQQRKGWAHTFLKKRINPTQDTSSSSSSSSSSLVLKRLAPTPTIPSLPSPNFTAAPPLASRSLIPNSLSQQSPTALFPPPSSSSFSSSASSLSAHSQLPPQPQTTHSPNVSTTSIADRLEASFWQAYPYLQQLFLNFTQHLTSSCQKILKEKVADMILTAWDLCEVIKKDLLTHHDQSVDQFEVKLEEAMTSLYLSTQQEMDCYLSTFISRNFEKTLLLQFEMYSLSKGVLSTAIQLTKRQQVLIQKSNLNYFSVYANKKINEVKIVCTQQWKKLLNSSFKKNPLPLPLHSEEDREGEEERRLKRQQQKQRPLDVKVLISEYKVLQVELRGIFEDFLHNSSSTQSSKRTGTSLRHCYRLKSCRCPRERSSAISEDDILVLFTTELCDLHLISPENLLELLQPTQQQRPPSFSSLCGTLCRFVAQLVTVVNKFLLLETYSSRTGCSCSEDSKLCQEISVMIVNICQFTSSLQAWVQKLLSDSLFSTVAVDHETVGRIKIEFNKMYLEIQLSLLFYDSFLQDHPPCPLQSEPTKPSSLILEAFEFKLIATRTIIRLLSTALKTNPLVFFPSFPIEASVLSLIREFLQRFHSSFSIPESSLHELFRGDGDEDCQWDDRPEILALMKRHISTEFGYVFEQLLQKFRRKVEEEENLLTSSVV